MDYHEIDEIVDLGLLVNVVEMVKGDLWRITL